MKMLLVIFLIYLAMVKGYTPRFSDEEKEVETRGFRDIRRPTLLSCPDDIVVSTSKRGMAVEWTIPAYSDNCGPKCPLRITSNFHPFTRFVVGTTITVQYEARDPSGNINRDCVFTVTVKDSEPPKLLFCPKDFEKSTVTSRILGSWLFPIYSDNCGTTCPLKITSNHHPDDFQKVGTSIEVRYTAEDPSGNKNVACKFTVRIKDIGPPKLLSCPKDIKISTTKSKERVSWSIPTYSDNCGTTCLIKIKSNHNPSELHKVGTSIEVRYTAEDPSGNKNDACRFLVRIDDIGPPTLLSCPDDIVKFTKMQSSTVDWKTPLYSDNCGPKCPLEIASSSQPRITRFNLGRTYTVYYEARDPSGNRNTDCTFTVTVKAYPCPKLALPKNGMFTEIADGLSFQSCKRGFYPTENLPFFYLCKQGKWQQYQPGQLSTITKLPDCILKTPPPGLNPAMYNFFTYDGDCNSATAQQQVQKNILLLGLCTAGCSINDFKSYCGQTTF